ncbi:MAG TPA: hypothetical protein VF859_08100 [Burkholderiales bacterium]
MSGHTMQLADLISSGLRTAGAKVEEEVRNSDAAGAASLAWDLVRGEAESRLKEALKADPLEFIVSAWSKAQELKKYADPAKYPPDQSVVVHLGEHKVNCTVHPEIEILFNGAPICTLKFTLELVAKFKSAALTIRGGAIRSVAPGVCSARVVLKYSGARLKEEETPDVRLPGRLDLGAGLPIG